MDNQRIFDFLSEKLDSGSRCILVTIISVEGSSMRDPGAHMGVCEDGSFVGSLSGGCIEAAVMAEALEALREGAARITRFGAGSKYLDIRLPCGGGLDIHFQPLAGKKLVESCLDFLNRRKPFSISLFANGKLPEFQDKWHETKWSPDSAMVTIGHWPVPKLLIIGHGAALSSLAMQARSMDLVVSVLTPDERLATELNMQGSEAQILETPRDLEAIKSDRWTAIIFMFHDHDWEGHLMKYALCQPHYYFGAMGGRKAHEFRSEVLRSLGVAQSKIESICAPVGLFHSSRDPDTLALSALAQLVEAYQKHDFAGPNG